MKVLLDRPDPAPEEKSWWDKIKTECQTCHSIIELEATDKPAHKDVQHSTGRITNIEFLCPVCNCRFAVCRPIKYDVATLQQI